jgi:hypothetical protein
MAVAVVMDFDGATLDQYDEIVAKMGFSPGSAGAPGSLFHWVTGTDGGMRVVDVWERQEDFEQFAAEKIGPLGAEVGFPGAPKTQFIQVHNYLTAG